MLGPRASGSKSASDEYAVRLDRPRADKATTETSGSTPAPSIWAGKGTAKQGYKSLHRAKGEEVALSNGCLFVLFLQSPSVLAVNAIASGLDEISRDYEWANYLSIIESGGSGFEGEARSQFAKV